MTLAWAYRQTRQHPYRLDDGGKTYEFSELAMLLAADAARRGDDRGQIQLLSMAHQANPRSPEPVRRIVEYCRRMNRVTEARRWSELLESMHGAQSQP